jgi:kynurenine formamidase
MNEIQNRFGSDDEVGALNLIGLGEVCDAVGLVKLGKVISLAQPIFPGMAMPSHRAGMMHFMDRDGGDYAAGARAKGGFQFAEDTIVMPVHTGTHIDALCHCWYDDTLYNGFPASSIRSTRGAERLGVEKMPPIVGRGVLLDFVVSRKEPLADGDDISVADVQDALSHADTTIRSGDIVLLRTGWLERQSAPATVDYNKEPGLGLAAADYIAGQGAAVIGADNFAVEAMPFAPGTIFPVHQRLIRDCGIPLLEGLVLKPLAEAGATAFLFVAAPLPIKGGTGSPLNPIAIL